MSEQSAEEIGFGAAWDGEHLPKDFAEWLKQPSLLSAWLRGYNQFHSMY